jgi:hypothetical protein
VTWVEILDQWELLEADLQDIRVDVGDDVVMDGRSWRWFEAKVIGVMTTPPSGFVQVAHPSDDRKVVNKPIFATRLQQHFYG